jgi:hypothetical protein
MRMEFHRAADVASAGQTPEGGDVRPCPLSAYSPQAGGVIRRPTWPWLLVILGVILITGAAIYGVAQMGAVGTGHLDTTPLGEQITFKPSGSYRANIFTPRQSPSSPGTTCHVETTDGLPVTLHDAAPYAVNTRYDMESAYGIHLSAGTTYLIACGKPGDEGSFAVVEITPTTQVAAFAVGTTGLMIVTTGAVIIVIRRRRRRCQAAATGT